MRRLSDLQERRTRGMLVDMRPIAADHARDAGVGTHQYEPGATPKGHPYLEDSDYCGREFKVKLSPLDIPQFARDALQQDVIDDQVNFATEDALNNFRDEVKAKYKWIGKVGLAGRGSGWLVIEDESCGYKPSPNDEDLDSKREDEWDEIQQIVTDAMSGLIAYLEGETSWRDEVDARKNESRHLGERTARTLQTNRPAIVDAMAKYAYASAWADAYEEKGGKFPPRAEIMDYAPPPTPEAKKWAEETAKKIEQMNDASLDDLIRKAMEADGTPGKEGDWVGEFGYGLALPSMGHGVHWFDNHEKFPLELPHTEFYVDPEDVTVEEAEAPSAENDEPVVVLFRKYPNGDIDAVFPGLQGTHQPGSVTVYSHVGQHSQGDFQAVMRQTEPALPSEYEALEKELEGMGYKLIPRSRAGRNDLWWTRRTDEQDAPPGATSIFDLGKRPRDPEMAAKGGDPKRIAKIRKIVDDSQAARVDGQMVDGYTASAIIQIYDKLNPANQEKYAVLPIKQMAAVAWKMIGGGRNEGLQAAYEDARRESPQLFSGVEQG